MFEVSILKKSIFVQSKRNTDLQRISYQEEIGDLRAVKIYVYRADQNIK